MSDEVSVVIRSYFPITDSAFIYSSWRNASYYGGKERADAKAFFKRKTGLIRDVVAKASVRIACVEGDPMTIVGYSVATGSHLEFIFVKVEFRGKGIGKLLMPKDIRTVTPNLTKIGTMIAQKKGLIIGPPQDE